MKPTDYTIIRSRRRSLELRLYPDRRIEVRVPMRTSEHDISSFIASKSGWLQRRLSALPESAEKPALKFCHGEGHLFLGERYPLSLNIARRSMTVLSDGCIEMLLPVPDDEQRVALQLSRWYRAQAETLYNRIIDQHFGFFAERGHTRPSLRIRSMKSRWGSLSSRGYINLNAELIKTPLRSIEYVVIHELCHLEHMNHGPGFRRLLSQRLPDWEQRKHELNLSPLI
ncbi:MAG: M48 family metallopeptidase [Alcanivoracaceae bacterium]|nr:M48 family metallopeptidase [Alcanivoracaceae bacterium]